MDPRGAPSQRPTVFEADRGSIPVVPLVGFGALLALSAVLPAVPIGVLLVVTSAVLGAVIGFTARQVRQDRSSNITAAARWRAQHLPTEPDPAQAGAMSLGGQS